MRILYFFLCIQVFYSCKQKPNNPNNFPLDQGGSNQDVVTNRSYEKSEVKKALIDFPTPYKLALLFAKENETDATLDWVDPKAEQSHSNFFGENLTIGIYQADLAFAAAFGEKNKFNQYYKVLNELSGNESIPFVPKFPNDSVPLIINNDSLVEFYNRFFVESDVKLKTETPQKTAIIVVTASWIESMYLGSKVVQDKNNSYKKIIAGQKESLNQLTQLWNSVDEKKSHGLRGRLEVLAAIYEKVEMTSGNLGFTAEMAVDSSAIVNDKITMSLPVMQAIEKELEGIRNYITKKSMTEINS